MWQPFRDVVDIAITAILAAILALFGWFGKRAMRSLDAKLDKLEYQQEMASVKMSLSLKAEQKDIDNQFMAVKNSLTSVDAKLNIILSQMIRK